MGTATYLFGVALMGGKIYMKGGEGSGSDQQAQLSVWNALIRRRGHGRRSLRGVPCVVVAACLFRQRWCCESGMSDMADGVLRCGKVPYKVPSRRFDRSHHGEPRVHRALERLF